MRLYFATRSRLRRVLAWVTAGFDGFWLGVMDADRLGRLDAAVYETLRETVDGERVGYEDDVFTESGLNAPERALIERHFPVAGRVLVTGAGGGREVLALLQAGYDALGFEPNPRLIEAGDRALTRLGHPGRLRAMRRSMFPDATGTADALVVGWTSYMLMPGSATRVAFLQAARRVLREDAPILVSVWSRGAADDHAARVARVGGIIRRLRGRAPIELGDGLAPNFVHCFTQPELEAELASAGFTPVEVLLDDHLWIAAVAQR